MILLSLSGGIVPFFIVGIIKAVLSATLGVLVRNRLTLAKLLPTIIVN